MCEPLDSLPWIVVQCNDLRRWVTKSLVTQSFLRDNTQKFGWKVVHMDPLCRAKRTRNRCTGSHLTISADPQSGRASPHAVQYTLGGFPGLGGELRI